VRWLQSSLNQVMNLQLPVNGIVGPETRSAVRSFQERNGLPPDGFAGPDTVQALAAARRGGGQPGAPPAAGNGAGNGAAPAPDAAPGEPAGEFWYGEVGGLPVQQTPWRARLGLTAKPQHLRYMNLDRFNWNQASLTPRLMQMARNLAEQVKLSWGTMRPIGFIRLIGHTDSTGQESNNRALGDRRAQAVKQALESLLKEEILKRRIAIIVEPGPGSSRPTADNRTQDGRALNRRVEVFVEPPTAPPDPTKTPDLRIKGLPPGPIIRTTPSPIPWGRLPTLPPGKSAKQVLDEWLRDRRVPKMLRDKIWDAIFAKNYGLLSSLLNAAGFKGSAKTAFLETARAIGQTPMP
jgi:outer membrane protein OmpA-like peptidoglycan-associated protein